MLFSRDFNRFSRLGLFSDRRSIDACIGFLLSFFKAVPATALAPIPLGFTELLLFSSLEVDLFDISLLRFFCEVVEAMVLVVDPLFSLVEAIVVSYLLLLIYEVMLYDRMLLTLDLFKFWLS